jgi:hypothetical protein
MLFIWEEELGARPAVGGRSRLRVHACSCVCMPLALGAASEGKDFKTAGGGCRLAEYFDEGVVT